MLLRAAIVCCLVTATLAADGHKTKKKDARDKRNLEYSIAHHYPAQNYRLERRISTAPQLTRYPPFFPPGPRPNTHRKGRPQSLPPPPYAVQMEPLVQYSQRDPLYDSKLLGLPTVSQNDLPKGEDLLTDNTHVYPHATPKHVIERPVYIKEPEPIIEIIIKESNETLPTVPTPITPPPKKKEDVQVFYVKYRKNPDANGKDSIIYEKPIPAISPEVKHIDENYKPPPEHVTHSPPPTTTLRAIIKPDSGIYHAPKGIRITFGPHTFHDDVNEESAPQPAVSLPHSEFENRPPNFPHRLPQPYRPFNQPPPPPPPTTALIKEQYPQFGVKLPPQLQQLPQTRNPQFLINRPPPPQFRQIPGHPPPPHKRQPVPYTPFGQIRPEAPVHFPGPHTHFPVKQEAIGFNELRQQFSQQQLPSVQHQQPFNPDLLQGQRPSFPQIPPQYINHLQSQQDAVLREQQFNHQQFNGNLPPSQQRPKTTHHPPQQQPQQQNQFNGEQFLPPGGQVISSVPKFEQHITVGGEQALPLQNPQNQQKFRQDDEIKTDQQQQQYYQQQLALRNQQQLALQNQQQEAQKQQLQLQQQEAQKQQFQLQQQQEAQKQQYQIQQQQEAQKQQYQIQQQQEAQKQQYQIQQQEAQKQQFQLQQQEAQKQQFHIQQQQLQELQQQSRNAPDPFYVGTTHPPQTAPTTTQRPPVTTERKPETTTKDPSELSKQLPDEVPDDLREQLLSSGILNHAQISVLDYDKVGDIPLSALPPDQLANFYNAGGGQQIAAGSAPVPSIVETPSVDDMVGEGSEVDEVKVPKDAVEMKVVRYDPETEDGKKIQESYVQDDATKVAPVVLNDNTYNRYLPLKVNGAEFPLPEIAELKGKKIDSVVVLAPVDYDFKEGGRVRRDAREKGEKIKFASGSALQELIEKPSKENYLRFLEHENRTSADKQAVILLVTGNVDTPKEEREIFMYDVATKTVSKLSGELSSAFVEAAEANSSSSEDTSASSSNLVEIRVPSPIEDGPVDNPEDADLEDSASDIVESRIPIIDPMEADLEPQASEQLDRFVDVSGEDLTASDTKNSIESEARFDLS